MLSEKHTTRFYKLARGLAFAALIALVSGMPSGVLFQDVTGQPVPVTLRLATLNDQEASITEIVRRFQERHPNVTIDVELYVSVAQLGPLYATQFQAGAAPDIGIMFGGTGFAGILTYAEQGLLIDLSDRPLAASLPKSFWKSLSTGAKLWGYPTGAAAIGTLVYSVDTFHTLGIKVPTDFPGLLAACKTISAAGIVPVAFTPGDGGFSYNGFTGLEGTFVYSKVPDWSEKRANHEVTFAGSGEWRTVFERVEDMIDAGCFSPGAVGTDINRAAVQFVSGRASMLWLGTAQLQIFLSIKPDFAYGMFAVPPDEGDPVGVHLQATSVYAVNAAATEANKAAALDFIDFLAEPEQTAAYNAADKNIILSGSSVVTGDYPTDSFPQLKSLLPALPPQGKDIGVVAFSTFPSAVVAEEVNNSIVAVFTGQRTIDASLAVLDKAWDGY